MSTKPQSKNKGAPKLYKKINSFKFHETGKPTELNYGH